MAHTAHLAAPAFSSCNRTHCSASDPSASFVGASSLQRAMSLELVGNPLASSGSSSPAEAAVA